MNDELREFLNFLIVFAAIFILIWCAVTAIVGGYLDER